MLGYEHDRGLLAFAIQKSLIFEMYLTDISFCICKLQIPRASVNHLQKWKSLEFAYIWNISLKTGKLFVCIRTFGTTIESLDGGPILHHLGFTRPI